MANDILLNETNDLQIANGDFVVGESNQQDIDLLLTTKKGEWKESPLVGANLQEYLKQREGLSGALKEVRQQLQQDGFRIKTAKIEGNNLNIDAERV
jgi:hypothetical protein